MPATQDLADGYKRHEVWCRDCDYIAEFWSIDNARLAQRYHMDSNVGHVCKIHKLNRCHYCGYERKMP